MSAPSLDHLRTFLAVTRAGSLSRAADELGIAQATVSAHIQALELALGHAVLVRTPQGAVATPKGAALARAIAPHLDALDDATDLLPAVEAAHAIVHIGGAAEFLGEFVLPRLGELAALSRVAPRIHFGVPDDLLPALASRGVDVVLSSVPPRLAGVAAAPLCDEEFALVGAPRWAGVAPDAIPVVAYAEDLPIVRRYWRSVFGRRPDALEVAAIVPDLRGIRSAVAGGLGMSVLPRYLVDADLAAGRLVLLDHPDVPPLNTIYLALRRGEEGRRTPAAAVARELRRMLG